MIKRLYSQALFMNNSYELLVSLKKAGYLKRAQEPLWWPRAKTFWIIVGAILTQQAKWEKVEISLLNLQNNGIDSLKKLAESPLAELTVWIKPSGFYNTKGKYLKILAQNIIKEFGSFEAFSHEVTRDWLLAHKGLGQESADAILCYACEKEFMVVDAYTTRLLASFGYEFDSYEALQEWMYEGVLTHWKAVQALYGYPISLQEVYARFHGKIVEFCKENSEGKRIKIECLGQ